jgi:hypothetical protein
MKCIIYVAALCGAMQVFGVANHAIEASADPAQWVDPFIGCASFGACRL